MRKVESRQQGPPTKNAKLDEVLAAHCSLCWADLVTECMKRTKTLILSGEFHFRFSTAENQCPFSFSAVNGISFSSFSFTVENEQEAQLMLTTGSTRLAVSRGQQTWYHSTCYI